MMSIPLLLATLLIPPAPVQTPEGFTPLFNGRDLAGWHGWKVHDKNSGPLDLVKLSTEERSEKIAAWTEDAKKHWSVENGELVNDGHGAYLATDKEYRDYELLIEYKTVAKADSGIYLKATPQVQIWDSTEEAKFRLGADKGSGGLWNNSAGAKGKDPLVLADKPFGEWNKFRIIQVGARTSVWLNDKLVVDDAVMENYWDRKSPLFPKGSIILQTHGGEIRWRNIYVREIQAGEANAWLRSRSNEKWTGSALPVLINPDPPVPPPVQYQIVEEYVPPRSVLTRLFRRGGHFRYHLIPLAPPPLPPRVMVSPSSRAGFFSAFNGVDLSGWAGATDNFEVIDGAIVCKPGKGGNLYTQEEYGDFVVRLEFKLPAGGNNGLAIRYPGKGDAAYGGMTELQVLDDTAAKYAKLDPRQYHGSAYGMTAAHRGFLRLVGEWNYQEVTVKGSTIKVELNGTVILNTDLSKVTKYMGNTPHPGKDLKQGHFGFAGHHDPVMFRNIEIKKLD
jgi:hypothetical protein